jgi:hypothetical protein
LAPIGSSDIADGAVTANKTDVALVTALPGSPYNGQVVDFLADQTNGVVWRLRFRSLQSDGVTPNPSSFKWEYIGGSDLRATVDAQQSQGISGYANLTTVGPSIALPLSGDWDVGVGCRIALGASTGQRGTMSYKIGATTALDVDGATGMLFPPTGTASAEDSVYNVRRKTGLSAGDTIVAQYKTELSAGISYDRRWMSLRPVRVS